MYVALQKLFLVNTKVAIVLWQCEGQSCDVQRGVNCGFFLAFVQFSQALEIRQSPTYQLRLCFTFDTHRHSHSGFRMLWRL